MVRHTLTIQDFIEARRLFDGADVPTEDRFVWTHQYYDDPEENSMTDTEDTAVQKILEDLSNDRHVTKSGYIVGTTYRGDLEIALNPIIHDLTNHSFTFTEEDIEELSDLIRLSKAKVSVGRAASDMRTAETYITMHNKETK